MSVKKPDIEILVVNHKSAAVPSNPLLKPIQVGAADASQKLQGMAYYDNSGENISELNATYCELTAIYWAWKNLQADYYGLFHYRRYLSFAPDTKENPYPGKAYPSVWSAIEEAHLNEVDMRSVIEQYDLIIPRKDDARDTTGNPSIYEQYKQEHYIKDLDHCIDYIQKNHKTVAPFLDALHNSDAYFCNMFVMKKELFQEYCEFMFDVLGDFEKNVDISSYNTQQHRVAGFLAERLTNVFLHYVIEKGEYKVKELQMLYFENTDIEVEVKPLSKDKDAVAIVLAADNFYVPYMSTLIHSIAEHANDKKTYDINIFHRDITSRNQTLLKEEFASRANISVRFCDMSHRMGEFEHLATKWHITIETYFRLFIQDIMKDYEKVLYLDGDMIVKKDIATLFAESVDGYILAAVRDVDMAGVYNSNTVDAENTLDPKRKNYIDNMLGLEEPFNYFQAGVLLLNLGEMRKAFSVQEAVNLASSDDWEYLDQDVLNVLAKNRVKYLDPAWNVLYDWEFVRIRDVISKAPAHMFKDYMRSRTDPFIIHYGGTIKPWSRPDCDYGEEYWKVAKRSVFYELIVGRMARWFVDNAKQAKKKRSLKNVRHHVVHTVRSVVDDVAPKGTVRRTVLTKSSRTIKRIIH